MSSAEGSSFGCGGSSFGCGSSSFESDSSRRAEDLIRRARRSSEGDSFNNFLSRLAEAERRDAGQLPLPSPALNSSPPVSEAGGSSVRSSRLQAALNAKVAEKKAKKKAARKASAAAPPPPPSASPGREHSKKKKKKQQQQPATPPSLRKGATPSMKHLLDMDDPVSAPVSPREEEHVKELRRRAARPVDLEPRAVDRERNRARDGKRRAEDGRAISPAGTPSGTPSGTPPSSFARRGVADGSLVSATAAEGRDRNFSAWSDAFTNAIAASAADLGSVARGVRSTIDGSGSIVDSVLNNACGAVSRVSGSVSEVSSYLPAPPVPGHYLSAPPIPVPSALANASSYLTNPAGIVQGIASAVDRAAELAPQAAFAGAAVGVRGVGAALSRY